MSTASIGELIRDGRAREVVPLLPDYLATRLERCQALQDELGTLQERLRKSVGIFGTSFLRKMPASEWIACGRRVRELEVQLTGLTRVIQALELGYEPYEPPANWWIGMVNGVRRKIEEPENGTVELQLVYKSSRLPAPVEEAYKRALETGVFDRVIIAAPERQVFELAAETDPVMVAYVRTDEGLKIRQPVVDNDKRNLMPGHVVNGGVGFLVMAWNFAKDRESAVWLP